MSGPPVSYLEYQAVRIAGAQGWWLVPGQERTSQRINVVKYPEWPELAAVPVVETWTPHWRGYETLNLSGDVVVSVGDSQGHERELCTVAGCAEFTSIWNTRR